MEVIQNQLKWTLPLTMSNFIFKYNQYVDSDINKIFITVVVLVTMQHYLLDNLKALRRVVPMSRYENTDFAQVVVGRGNIAGLTLSPTREVETESPL